MNKSDYFKTVYTNQDECDDTSCVMYSDLDELVAELGLEHDDEIAVYELKYVKKLKLKSELV